MILRLHRLAVAEIDHEVDYYEAKQAGLGAELEDEIDAVERPRRSARRRARSLSVHAPYQTASHEIVVLALAHTSRRPGYWARRR